LAIITHGNFIFAAPGAVVIMGYLNREQTGIVGMAGPLTNIILSLLFFFLMGLNSSIAKYGMQINAWLALFNLIPFPPLDGEKVINWNSNVWVLLFGISMILLFYSLRFY